MAYIGKPPVNGFFSKQTITGDGSTTTFALTVSVADPSSLIVSVGGVLQEPGAAYSLSGGGANIVFSTAPSSTDTAYVQFLGTEVQMNTFDTNGSELILDVNGNTSLHADTDDEIDIQVGGTDRSTIKATGFHNVDSVKFVAGTGDDLQLYHDGTNSYLTNSTGALKLATETSGIAITIGHSTSEVTIADNATVAGNLTVTGTLTQTGTQTFDGGIDVDDFNINGTTLALSSGDMTVDVAGDIILDADGGDVFVKDGGTTFGSLTNTSGNLIIKSGTTTAATFSGANVTLAGTVGSGAITSTGIVTGTGFTAGSAVLAEAELELLDGLTAGTAIASKVVTTDSNIDTTGQRNLTITGALTSATLDISGNADIDGTLEADAYTVDGTALNEYIADTIGAMVTSNTESGITVAYQDGDNTLDFTIGTLNQNTTGTAAVATVATTVTITDNENTDEANAVIFTAGGDVDGGNLGLESDGDLTYNPSTGTLNVPNISVTGTQTIVNSVTMNASNAVIFEGATADAYETTLTSVDATSSDKTISLPNVSGTLPVLAAASTTAITSTPAELNLLDTASANSVVNSKAVIYGSSGELAGTLSTVAQGNVTSVGTLTALQVDNININGSVISNAAAAITIDCGSSNDDIIFKGTDGGVDITAMYLDMSAKGSAYFNGYIRVDQDIGSGASGTTGAGAYVDIYSHTGSSNNNNTDGQLGFWVNNTKKWGWGMTGQGGTSALTDMTLYNIASDNVAFSINGSNVTTFNAKIEADSGIDIDNFNIDGTTIALSSGNLILDSAAEIHIDAGDVAKVIFKDDGTEMWRQFQSSSDVYIRTAVSDKDYYIQGNDGGSNITMMRLDASAAGAAIFNNDVTAFSDERLKSNIETIPNALDKVCAMRGVTFDRIDVNDGGRQTGVIAQEIQDILPEVVKINDDENQTLSVSYGNMVGVLIEAIKDLKAEIDTLKGN